MKTTAELYRYLTAKIPPALRADWDNDGLMCASDPERAVRRVVIALDVTEPILARAVALEADVILSHHPLIFGALESIDPSHAVARKLVQAIKHDIAVFSFHTTLDAAEGGVNDVLASRLGLTEIFPFGETGEAFGRIGRIESPMSAADFAHRVKEHLGADRVTLSDAGRPVSRVAVLGGKGSDFVEAALRAGADTFVSGELGYHILLDAPETGINLIEAGHFFTEAPVCTYLSELVQAFDREIETVILDSYHMQVL